MELPYYWLVFGGKENSKYSKQIWGDRGKKCCENGNQVRTQECQPGKEVQF